MNDKEILDLASAMPRSAMTAAIKNANDADTYWRAQNLLLECQLVAVRRAAIQVSLISDGALSILSRVR
jgi:hypothetical protein